MGLFINKKRKKAPTKEIKNKKDKNQIEDYFQTTLDDYDKFDIFAHKKGGGYKIPGFPAMEEKLEGLEEGMYLIAAESNFGKSAILSNLLYSICTYKKNNLFGIYYSLDDNKFEIIPRLIAMNQLIPIGICSKPMRYQKMIDKACENSVMYKEWLEKRQEGLDKLRKLNNLLKIEDSGKIKTAKQIHDHMEKLLIFVKSFNPDCNLAVAIDSINDIHLDKGFSSSKEENAYRASMVKGWTTEFKIPIFSSVHMRKINQNRRPILDDLKEGNEYVYESSLTWLLYNDVSKNKQAAKIFYRDGESEEKLPIIELDWAKNKKSSYKGRTFYYFASNFNKVEECDIETMKRYDSLIYDE